MCLNSHSFNFEMQPLSLADATFQISAPDRAEQGGLEAAVAEGQVQRAANEDAEADQAAKGTIHK